jgi:hypothetical protein
MFDKNIDVAEIMIEIQKKAKLKRVMSGRRSAAITYDALRDELDSVYLKTMDISEEVIKKHNYTKEHENTALRLPVNRQRFVLLRKAVTFTKRCVRKLTKFIWVEQNEVNISLNENIKMLYQVQMEMSKSFAIFDNILSSLEGIDKRVKNIEKTETDFNEGNV